MNKIPTVRNLAALAGCSQTTVALALRGHPRISKATKERIQKLAKEHGYTRDPVVSTLMGQLRILRRKRSVTKIALLSWWEEPNGWRKSPRGIVQYAGMKKRAEQLGYEVEDFWAREPGMTNLRISRILQTRGIRGVVLLSKPSPRGRVLLNWDQFAVATTSYTIFRTDINRATHHHFHGMTQALRECRHLGYTRIGYVNDLAYEERTNYAWLSAYTGSQYRQHGAIPVPPLLTTLVDRKSLASWLKKYSPQVVLGCDVAMLEAIRALGYRVPDDIGFVALDCLPGVDSCAGIDQIRGQVGAKTIELVVEQLENNEFGLPAYPKTVMVEGVWHKGDSVRRQK